MSNELLDDLDYLEEKIPEYVYGGFWRRFGAIILDGLALLIILIFWVAIGGLLGLLLPATVTEFLQNSGSLIIMFLYFPVCESSNAQATIGKYIFGMKVIHKNGTRITFWRALARFFSKMLSYSFASIGFIMVAFMKKKQGLHDLIVSTYVVER